LAILFPVLAACLATVLATVFTMDLAAVLDFAADLVEVCLRTADVEREVIVLRTCVQAKRTGKFKFKSTLIAIGDSAPIRDK
jgi:hypothetical protein